MTKQHHSDDPKEALAEEERIQAILDSPPRKMSSRSERRQILSDPIASEGPIDVLKMALLGVVFGLLILGGRLLIDVVGSVF